jgi:hypothetical protein
VAFAALTLTRPKCYQFLAFGLVGNHDPSPVIQSPRFDATFVNPLVDGAIGKAEFFG